MKGLFKVGLIMGGIVFATYVVVLLWLFAYSSSASDYALSLEPQQYPNSVLVSEIPFGGSSTRGIVKSYCTNDEPRRIIQHMEQYDLTFSYRGEFDYYFGEVAIDHPFINISRIWFPTIPHLQVEIPIHTTSSCPDGTSIIMTFYWEKL